MKIFDPSFANIGIKIQRQRRFQESRISKRCQCIFYFAGSTSI